MDPVFTLQWPEYLAAERLQSQFPKKDGYSVYIPLSRQEKGVDIALLYRKGNLRKTITFQVKASRTHLGSPAKRGSAKERYKFYTWFNRFDPPTDADYFLLVGLFAPDTARTKRVNRNWYSECILMFTYAEMKRLMGNCLTVGGKPDRMFGFKFNDLSSIIYYRGDSKRRGKDYSTCLLSHRIHLIHDTK